MGSVAEKINFTRIAIDNIEKALGRKGYDMTQYNISHYAELIDKLGGNLGGGGAMLGIRMFGIPPTTPVLADSKQRRHAIDTSMPSMAMTQKSGRIIDINTTSVDWTDSINVTKREAGVVYIRSSSVLMTTLNEQNNDTEG